MKRKSLMASTVLPVVAMALAIISPMAMAAPEPPNILLVIMDDVGVDQMASFGYGGVGLQVAPPPSMPSIDAIAGQGLRFRNTWAMPECSPTRAALLTGRYPLRNNVMAALGPNDLANSQVDPYDTTIPKLLKHAGYVSGMFGKFHIAGPENNEAGNGTPAQLGWDQFWGWTSGLPDSIDTTAGGVAAPGTYSCGFVPDSRSANGADIGACYLPPESPGLTASCAVISGNSPAGDSPGLQCLSRGGILVPDAAVCESTPPSTVKFDRPNAHYASALVVNQGDTVDEVNLGTARGRGYRSTIEVDAAIEWIRARSATPQPWMATISFSAAHTPLQPPPGALLPSGVAGRITADCTNILNQRTITDAMIEAMDSELGRLLVETGIAQRADDGSLSYDPAATNTMVVIIGDNGSYATTVKLPFDPTRNKGTAYQTGVWVPLIMSGPIIKSPDRNVEHMVNVTDIYRLMGQIAGLDVDDLTPRGIDGVSMLRYLRNPDATGRRKINYAEGGLNIQVNGGRNGPCVIATTCSHTPVTKSVCEDNTGTWWGKGADPALVLKVDLEQCWQVNQAIYENDPANYPANKLIMANTTYRTVRNDQFKLVRNETLDYDPPTDTSILVSTEELYRINQNAPIPAIDRANLDLLALPGRLTKIQRRNYAALSAAMDDILASEVACPGDGNDDGRVDQTDLDNQAAIAVRWGKSSTYDFDYDGLTNDTDRSVIESHLGDCPGLDQEQEQERERG